jgi:hypothetical protein
MEFVFFCLFFNSLSRDYEVHLTGSSDSLSAPRFPVSCDSDRFCRQLASLPGDLHKSVKTDSS